MRKPKTFETIKQPRGGEICAACVAAMAVGRSLAYAQAEMTPTVDGKRMTYGRRELLAFLGRHGIHAGAIATPDPKPDELRALGRHEVRRINWAYEGRQAVLVVESEGRGRVHLVFWDGATVRDPNPGADGRPLLAYTVREVWPLTYIDDDATAEAIDPARRSVAR